MDTQKDSSPKPAQTTVIFRLAAGGYLVYLAWSIFQELYKGPKPPGGEKLLMLGAALLFAAVGAALAGWSLMKLIKGEFTKYGQNKEGD